jgi:phage-related protein
VPQTRVVFYREDNGQAPVFTWLQQLRRENMKAYAKCVARIHRLATVGHELRRPEAENLGEDIYELRARYGHVNYRILYFFYGRTVAVLAHAMTKEDDIPETDFERAVRRKIAFQREPAWHTYEEEV